MKDQRVDDRLREFPGKEYELSVLNRQFERGLYDVDEASQELIRINQRYEVRE